MKKFLIVVAAILIIIGGFFVAGYMYIYNKINKVTYKPIDEADLGITVTTKEEDIEKYTRFVIFGSDSRDTSNAYAGRSDTILIVSINNESKSVTLISIPRDSYVEVPGYGNTKINHAYAYGQEQLSLKTINQNFGLDLKQYITIDFSGLVECIDRVGGVYVDINYDEMVFINARCNTQIAAPGRVLLNGEQALVHSRNRANGLDFARGNRQRQILMALIEQMAERDVNEILSVSDFFLENVTTNMDVDKYRKIFVELAEDRKEYAKNITSVQIPSTDYGYDLMLDGIYYFGFDKEQAINDFKKYYYNEEQ